jgi:hypothetical protein
MRFLLQIKLEIPYGRIQQFGGDLSAKKNGQPYSEKVAVVKGFTWNDWRRLKRANQSLTFAPGLSSLPDSIKDNILQTIEFALKPLDANRDQQRIALRGQIQSDTTFPAPIRQVLASFQIPSAMAVGRLQHEDMYHLHWALSRYLFRWEHVPGEDTQRLKDVLKNYTILGQNLGLSWVQDATVTKNTDNSNIVFTTPDHSLSLNLAAQGRPEQAIYEIALTKDGQITGVLFFGSAKDGDIYIYQDDKLVSRVQNFYTEVQDDALARESTIGQNPYEMVNGEAKEEYRVVIYQHYTTILSKFQQRQSLLGDPQLIRNSLPFAVYHTYEDHSYAPDDPTRIWPDYYVSPMQVTADIKFYRGDPIRSIKTLVANNQPSLFIASDARNPDGGRTGWVDLANTLDIGFQIMFFINRHDQIVIYPEYITTENVATNPKLLKCVTSFLNTLQVADAVDGNSW